MSRLNRRPYQGGPAALTAFFGLVYALHGAPSAVAQAVPGAPGTLFASQGAWTDRMGSVTPAWSEGGRELPFLITQTQESSRVYRRTAAGLWTGFTVGAIATTVGLSGEGTCTGSGDYLKFCHYTFVLGSAVAGGVGALIGRAVRRDTPQGRMGGAVLGSALGTATAFIVSLTCTQYDPASSDFLCGWDGMLNPGAALAGAGLGGVAGFVLGSSSNRVRVARVGPMGGSRSIGLELAVPVGGGR